MRHYIDFVATILGVPVPGATVDVRVANAVPGTGALATIYSDDGITTTANPVTCDSTGTFNFYVADGRYDLVVKILNVIQRTQADVEIADVTQTNLGDATFNIASANIATLAVSGNQTIGGTLIVAGNTTLNSGTFNGTFAGNPTLSGNVSIGGTLGVTGTTTLNSGTMNGTFGGNPTLSGNIQVGGTLQVTGATTLNSGTLNGTFGGNPILSGNVSMTGTLVTSNAGNFTDVNTFNYHESNVGSLDINAEIVAAQGTGHMNISMVGGVAAPNTTAVLNSVGIAGFATVSATGKNAIGGYFQGRALVNNSTAFGGNSQVQDVVGLTAGVALNGHEFDVGPLNASTAYTSVTGIPVVLAAGSHAGTYGDAVVASTNKATTFWGNGFRSAHGSAITAFYAGKAVASGASASQPLSFVANDGASDFTGNVSLSNAVDWIIPIAKTGRNILIQNNAITANLVQINDTGVANFNNPTNSPLKLDWSATDVGNIAGGGTAPGLRISGAQLTGQNGVVIIANNRVDGTETARFTTSTKSMALNGLMTTYNAIATADFGLPAIVGTPVHLSGQTGNLGATNLFSAAPAAGVYEISFCAFTTTSGTGTTMTVSIAWTDAGGAKTFTSATWALNSVTITGYVTGVLVVRTSGAANITVSTTGTIGTSQYAIDAYAKRIQ